MNINQDIDLKKNLQKAFQNFKNKNSKEAFKIYEKILFSY